MPFIGTFKQNNIQTPHGLLDDFPMLELWRFFIDGDKQTYGWQDFENREPGYTTHMIQSFLKALSTWDRAPSLALLEELHSDATKGVFNLTYTIEELLACKAYSFRPLNSYAAYPLMPFHNLSISGLSELKALGNNLAFYITTETREKEVGFLFTSHEENHIALADTYLRQYGDASEKPERSEDDKIRDLIQLVSNLERLHPFPDGNIRTLAMLLLHHESLRMNIVPPILNNPNVFDGFGQDEIFQEFKKGQERTLFFIKLEKNRVAPPEVPRDINFEFIFPLSRSKAEPPIPLDEESGSEARPLSNMTDIAQLERRSIPRAILGARKTGENILASSPLAVGNLNDSTSFMMVIANALLMTKSTEADEKAIETLEAIDGAQLKDYLFLAMASNLLKFTVFCSEGFQERYLIENKNKNYEGAFKYYSLLILLQVTPGLFLSSKAKGSLMTFRDYKILSEEISAFLDTNPLINPRLTHATRV